ncbi:recombinase family protein [Streptomyces sp. NPDC002644]
MSTREDYETLQRLGFDDNEIKALGLWEPAEGSPDDLTEAYIRRSKKSEDLATLRSHLRQVTNWCNQQYPPKKIRKVWFEQLSASKVDVRRVEFEGAVAAVLEEKLSKNLAFWKTDRLDRRGLGEVGQLMDRFERVRAGIISTTENLDSRNSGARMIFGFLSERAREEVKDIAKRVKIGHDSHKAMGRRGTGPTPFGLMSPRTEDGKPSGLVEPHPTEYKTARRLADLLLGKARNLPKEWADSEGKPLPAKAVAHILNAEGHRTRGGFTWSPTAVLKLAQSPLFAGLVPVRERIMDADGNPTSRWRDKGEPMTGKEGELLVCGTGVITPSEFFEIRALISGRTNKSIGRGQPGTKYLGTGIYRCGRINKEDTMCLSPMGFRGHTYRCVRREERGKTVCLGCVTAGKRIDDAVGRAFIRHVQALDENDPVLFEIGKRWFEFSDPTSTAEREALENSLRAAKDRADKLNRDYYVHGRLTEDQYDELSQVQRDTIEVIQRKLSAYAQDADLSPLMEIEALTEAWEDADIAKRRLLLKAALGKNGIIVAPAKRQGDPTPIEDRLTFDWISAP